MQYMGWLNLFYLLFNFNEFILCLFVTFCVCRGKFLRKKAYIISIEYYNTATLHIASAIFKQQLEYIEYSRECLTRCYADMHYNSTNILTRCVECAAAAVSVCVCLCATHMRITHTPITPVRSHSAAHVRICVKALECARHTKNIYTLLYIYILSAKNTMRAKGRVNIAQRGFSKKLHTKEYCCCFFSIIKVKFLFIYHE